MNVRFDTADSWNVSAPESHYDKVLEVLDRHLAALNARGMLDRAIRMIGVTATTLDAKHHAALVGALRPGLKVFLDGNTQTSVLRELETLNIGARALETLSIRVVEEADISVARNSARKLCQQMGARALLIQRVATIVSELARNIVSYTSGGVVDLVPVSAAPRRVHIRAIDNGAGIDNLEEVLSGNYRSRTGLGMGLLGTKRLADAFNVDTSRFGTRIDVEIYL